MKQILLEGPRDLRVGDHAWPGVGEAASLRVAANQLRRGFRRRAEDFRRRWRPQGYMRERPAILGEVFRRQRYQTPAAGCAGALMDALAGAVQHDVAPSHLDPAPDSRGALARGERD